MVFTVLGRSVVWVFLRPLSFCVSCVCFRRRGVSFFGFLGSLFLCCRVFFFFLFFGFFFCQSVHFFLKVLLFSGSFQVSCALRFCPPAGGREMWAADIHRPFPILSFPTPLRWPLVVCLFLVWFDQRGNVCEVFTVRNVTGRIIIRIHNWLGE